MFVVVNSSGVSEVIHRKDLFATLMFNEPSPFGPLSPPFPPTDACNRAASGVVACVVPSCVMPQKGGGLAEPVGWGVGGWGTNPTASFH